MHLKRLSIAHLRNLLSVDVELSPKLNILYGANGSGKTSFLEAIYYLGMGRSFRSKSNSRLINHEANFFSVFAQIQQQNQLLSAGIERSRSGGGKIRIAGQFAKSVIEISKVMPLQLLNPESRFLLITSSKLRRQFIDWGVFHVEHGFYHYWQLAQRALKQRNAALKSSLHRNLITLWDDDLNSAASALDAMRLAYISELSPIFNLIAKNIFSIDGDIELRYYSGWEGGRGLGEILDKSLKRDMQLGYTQFGPHRADLQLCAKGELMQNTFSHGQQKLVIYGLSLARGILLHRQTGKRCIYLFDDLASELDRENRSRVYALLQDVDAQIVITSVNEEILSENILCAQEAKLFHVLHGAINLSTS